jgi:hypothetical protein
MPGDVALDGIDLIECASEGLSRRLAHGIGPDGEKHTRDMAPTHAREIDLAVVVLLGEVVVFVEDHLAGVVMQIQHDGALQQACDAAGIDLRLRRRTGDGQQNNQRYDAPRR